MRCTSCHEPHASEEPNLLNASSKTLCLTCHSLNVPEFSSGAHGSLDCVRCHNIHDVRYAGLLSNSNPELCYECHSLFDDPVHFHPASPSYYDTHSERPLTCTSTCHNPHGTTNPYMLRVPYGTSGKGTDYLCLLCHTKVGLEY